MELVIFIGLQASGKTTFFLERLAATHVHVSMDLWPTARRPRLRLLRELEAALGAGRDVVVDNTNPTVADRAPLIATGRRHGARVRGQFFETTLVDAWTRNAQRVGRACVPEVALRATAAKLQRPTLSEGFDELACVRLGASGFVVADE